MTEKLNREYTITFDSTDASYVARCITPKLEWLCGHGDSEESAKKMAEDIIEELRCPDCGHYPAERGSEITKLKARIAELEGVDASLESRHKKDEQAEHSHDQRIADLARLLEQYRADHKIEGCYIDGKDDRCGMCREYDSLISNTEKGVEK